MSICTYKLPICYFTIWILYIALSTKFPPECCFDKSSHPQNVAVLVACDISQEFCGLEIQAWLGQTSTDVSQWCYSADRGAGLKSPGQLCSQTGATVRWLRGLAQLGLSPGTSVHGLSKMTASGWEDFLYDDRLLPK